MTSPGPPRGLALASALALALAPAMAEAADAVTCPDPATVQAARLVEFQTMMMGVAVRCRHVGVPIADHLDGMNTARRTMFTGANDRVATYLRSINTKLGPATMPQTALAAAPAPPPSAGPAKALNAKPAPARIGAARPAPSKTAAGKTAAARAAAGQAPLVPAKAAPDPAPTAVRPRKAALAATPALPAKPAAKVSRRTDPYDRYLTMIGNQYGGGVTTLQRCKAFDAIVLSLADKTNTDRLLTMISSSLVQATLLEAIVNCPAGK